MICHINRDFSVIGQLPLRKDSGLLLVIDFAMQEPLGSFMLLHENHPQEEVGVGAQKATEANQKRVYLIRRSDTSCAKSLLLWPHIGQQ